MDQGATAPLCSDLSLSGTTRSLHKGAVAPWSRGPSPLYTQTLQALSRHYGFSMDEPWYKLPDQAKDAAVERFGCADVWYAEADVGHGGVAQGSGNVVFLQDEAGWFFHDVLPFGRAWG